MSENIDITFGGINIISVGTRLNEFITFILVDLILRSHSTHSWNLDLFLATPLSCHGKKHYE